MSLRERIRVFNRMPAHDARGWLLKPFTGQEGHEAREVYVVYSLPGQVRGQHYHRLATELFTVLEGQARLELLELHSGARCALTLRSEEPMTVEVPPGVAHAIIAEGAGPLMLLAVATQPYDPADTLPYKLV